MLFNSQIFLFYFLPISLVGFYALAYAAGPTFARIWLILASFIFYGWFEPKFIILLVISIAFNFSLSACILNSEDKPQRQTFLLTAGVVANLAALGYYKYLFAVMSFLNGLGVIEHGIDRIILPLGISFFTFTQIGYLVDCQEGRVQEKGLIDYVLFVTFFPHLIAGPILHHSEVMPQFADKNTYKIDERKISAGFTLFIFGLFKKVLLADNIAPWADAGFSHTSSLGAFGAWSTIFAYSMQLYFDFSGYSDMAVGLGAMFGVRLPLNFNSPYKADSIIEFWRHWHMTLTRYITLLLYDPIAIRIRRRIAARRVAKGLPISRKGGQKPGEFAILVAFPTLLTMFIAGIWHGAGFQFIVFGLLHGVYLTINHAWKIFGPKPSKTLSGFDAGFRQIRAVLLTYFAVLLAQIFFRAASISDAVSLIAGALGSHGVELPLQFEIDKMAHPSKLLAILARLHIVVLGKVQVYDTFTVPFLRNAAIIMAMWIVVWFMPNSVQLLGENSPSFNHVQPMRSKWLIWKPNFVWVLVASALLFWVVINLNNPTRFLYFQF